MNSPSPQPIAQVERYAALDVLRGLALLGVLLVNIESDFRISLSEKVLTFHTHPDWLDRTVDVLVEGVFSFKAFSLFSLSFGIGVAVQAERTALRERWPEWFLARRFLVLLAIGLGHILLIWNGDILVLYAVCGLLLLPLLRLPPWALALSGVAAIGSTFVLPLDSLFPVEFTPAQAAESTKAYARGTIGEIMAFRWREARELIAPLLIGVLPRTVGLMLLGLAGWRSGVLREPHRHRGLLLAVLLGGALVGAPANVMHVYSISTGYKFWISAEIVDSAAYIPLALAYAAAIFLWLGSARRSAFAAPLAALGQLALTNYLSQSVILGFVFYGYGLGLFGQLGPAAAALIGVTLYLAQIAFSMAWLRWFQFGPVEWLWRTLTYCRLQPFRKTRP